MILLHSKKNIYGRSVRLDALCTLGDGSKVNIEVQRSDKDDHLRRARFNASSITVVDSNTGDDFSEILELYIVYISEFDFLKGEKTIYHIDKTIRETGQVVDDGLHEIFVNTVINDGSDIADLMSNFLKREIKDPKFPALTEETARLKNTEGGLQSMCKVMQYYEGIAEAKGVAKGEAMGIAKGEVSGIVKGKAEERAAIRERMIAHGMSLTDIEAILA